ncbi:hypothetical protein B0H10DRAFT_2214074 [Mycena sp. CBHHK59/15]|nr:hypothetical protein B0H10DRAFT_2214074 [Mycena sp. CBHHK59/15]
MCGGPAGTRREGGDNARVHSVLEKCVQKQLPPRSLRIQREGDVLSLIARPLIVQQRGDTPPHVHTGSVPHRALVHRVEPRPSSPLAHPATLPRRNVVCQSRARSAGANSRLGAALRYRTRQGRASVHCDSVLLCLHTAPPPLRPWPASTHQRPAIGDRRAWRARPSSISALVLQRPRYKDGVRPQPVSAFASTNSRYPHLQPHPAISGAFMGPLIPQRAHSHIPGAFLHRHLPNLFGSPLVGSPDRRAQPENFFVNPHPHRPTPRTTPPLTEHNHAALPNVRGLGGSAVQSERLCPQAWFGAAERGAG